MRKWVLLGATLALFSGVAIAANNFPVDTFAGTRTVLKSTDNAGVHTLHVNVDTAATTPTGVTTTVTTSAPTAATFSSVLASSSTRKGCTVTNIGTTQGFCNAIATASATTSNTMPLVANGGQFSCNLRSGLVITDNIACTCASGTCAFVVNAQ